jgi:cobalt-zinc-cadmium efflux system outer membrane protein
LLKAGVGPRSDVLLLQIELSKSEAELRNAHTLAETSRRELAAATGLVDLAIPRVAGDLQQALPNYELLPTQQAVLARNALVRRAQFEVGRWEFLLRRAEVDPFPNIDMMGGYQRQQPGNGFPLDQGMYQVQVVVPLYNQNQGNIRAAQATIASSVAAYNRVRTELANETALAFGRYITARQFADRYRDEILPSAVSVQRITGQLYNQGQVEFLRYLESQRALLDANLAYILAQKDRWIAAAELASLLQSEQFP